MTDWKALIEKVSSEKGTEEIINALDFCDLLYEVEVIEKKETEKAMDKFVNQNPKTETNSVIVDLAKHTGRLSAFAEIRKALEDKGYAESQER